MSRLEAVADLDQCIKGSEMRQVDTHEGDANWLTPDTDCYRRSALQQLNYACSHFYCSAFYGTKSPKIAQHLEAMGSPKKKRYEHLCKCSYLSIS